MPENDATSSGTNASFTVGTSTSDWVISSNNELDMMLKDLDKKAEKVKKKIEKKSDETMLYSCDMCGSGFRATKKEINAQENGGYYCSLKCKIAGKYGRSSLDESFFELEEEIEGNNVANT